MSNDLISMLWLRAVIVWLILMVVEIVHGTMRAVLLVPRVGDLRARQIGVFIGRRLILLITYLATPWLLTRQRRLRRDVP